MKRIMIAILAGSLCGPLLGAEKKVITEINQKIVVYYFHGQFRCPSCKKIEAYTEEAVKTNFAEALKSGKMEYKVVNVEDKGHEHFVNEYQLYTKSVVIVDMDGDKQVRWKNLPKVWEFLSHKQKFAAYIRDEIKDYQKRGA